MVVVVAYDIVDDARREDVASLLSGHGPRVQLSVFECEVRSPAELQSLRAARSFQDRVGRPGISAAAKGSIWRSAGALD